jgi:protein involved in polysaccharide export with SLBB domain
VLTLVIIAAGSTAAFSEVSSMDQPSANATTQSEAADTRASDYIDVGDWNPNSLVNVERINLRVWGRTDLSGEYAVGTDSTISIPGLGRIDIGSHTQASLEEMLSRKLTDAARREINVAVDVANFRPFYMMGQIGRPGAVEWRPGLNVIQAISLAGGVVRPETAPSSAAAQALVTQQSKTQLRFALAQLARLQAEKDGKSSVENGQGMATLLEAGSFQTSASLNMFLDRQNAMLLEQRKLMQSQIEALDRDHGAAKAELEAAESQLRTSEKQLEITHSLLRDIEALKAKRLVANARYLTQRSETLTAEARHAEIRSSVEGARVRVSQLAGQITRLQQERQAVLNDRIEELEGNIAQLELTLADAAAQSGPPAPTALTYNIARKGVSGMDTVAATIFTEIMPGDVIIISDESASHRGVASNALPLGPQSADAGSADALSRTRSILEAAATTPPIASETRSSYGSRLAR